jgi:hypothetical protein
LDHSRRLFYFDKETNMTMMPQDLDGRNVPVLGLRRTSGTHQVAIAVTSARNSTAFDPSTRVVSLFATVNCYIEQGDSSVTATTSRHFLPAGMYIDLDIGGTRTAHNPYVAVIRASSDGTLYISERE